MITLNGKQYSSVEIEASVIWMLPDVFECGQRFNNVDPGKMLALLSSKLEEKYNIIADNPPAILAETMNQFELAKSK